MFKRHPGACLCCVNICTFFPLFLCVIFPFSSSSSLNFPLVFVSNHFYCFVFLPFSCSHFILRDKAPGQRECDSSIDNINKCIRNIEQASLAAVSQNLPSRDDISLEVSNHQQMTQCFLLSPTTIILLPFVSICLPRLVIYLYCIHFLFFPVFVLLCQIMDPLVVVLIRLSEFKTKRVLMNLWTV